MPDGVRGGRTRCAVARSRAAEVWSGRAGVCNDGANWYWAAAWTAKRGGPTWSYVLQLRHMRAHPSLFDLLGDGHRRRACSWSAVMTCNVR